MRNIAPKLYQRARDSLAADIVNGAIPTTKRLTESWVAELFGISRVPARQALAELERRGLIRKAEGRGYAIAEEATTKKGVGCSSGDQFVSQSKNSRMQFMPSWQFIYTEIESEIFARSSLASWRVNALALAKHYGVSRTVAQDVMGRLQQRGIIRKDERGRWLAPALTDKHIRDLFELRWVLEPLALEKALPRLPEGLLERVRRNLDEAVAAPLVAGETLDRLEQELHVELLGYCDSASLLEAIRLPQTLFVAHHFLYQWTSGLFASEPFLPEHLEIVTCLQSDNLAGAQRALVHHLQISHERAMLRINTLASTIRPRELPYLERQS